MTTPLQQKRRRPRSRGVAALEFALSLTFLAPLASAAVDYGYYFYVGSSAEEAARAGLRQAILAYRAASGSSGCLAAQPGFVSATNIKANLQNPTNNGEAFQVMDQPPLGMKSDTQVQLTCDADPVVPSWHIMVRVDFKPAMGFVMPYMPNSGGKLRYTARLHGN